MLRVLGVAALAAAVVVSAAGAAGPHLLRTARPADAAPQSGPNVLTQLWHVVAIDRRTQAAVDLRVDSLGSDTGAQLQYWPGSPHQGFSQTFSNLGPPGSAPGFAARNLTLAYAGGRWTLTFDQSNAKGTLTFTSVRPGPTAASWPIGTISGPGTPTYLSTYAWSVPVAAARVTGTLELDGRRVDLSGWAGYVDHTWGRFDPSGPLMQHWDWAVAEDATGAWIVDGFESGTGTTKWKAHDDLWSGVLVHVAGGRAVFCRTRAGRGMWTETYAGGVAQFLYPRTLVATCGGMRVALARTKRVAGAGTAETETSVTTSRGGYGLWDERVG